MQEENSFDSHLPELYILDDSLFHQLDDSVRQKILRFSYHALKTNPLFGVGFGNFSQLKMNDIRGSVLEDKGVLIYFTYAGGVGKRWERVGGLQRARGEGQASGGELSGQQQTQNAKDQ